MAFGGIFQPYPRLRWIRFGLRRRGVNSGDCLKSHRQGPCTDYSAQRARPGDPAMRRASRAKVPADNKLCAAKAEGISWRLRAPAKSFSKPRASIQFTDACSGCEHRRLGSNSHREKIFYCCSGSRSDSLTESGNLWAFRSKRLTCQISVSFSFLSNLGIALK